MNIIVALVLLVSLVVMLLQEFTRKRERQEYEERIESLQEELFNSEENKEHMDLSKPLRLLWMHYSMTANYVFQITEDLRDILDNRCTREQAIRVRKAIDEWLKFYEETMGEDE